MTKRQLVLLFIQLFCMAQFLIIDFFVPAYASMSSILKFALVICAYLFAWPNPRALPLMITIVCDYLLLFTPYYQAGVCLFSMAHLLYCYLDLLGSRRQLAALLLLLLPLYGFTFLLPLPLVCLGYAAAFCLHIGVVKSKVPSIHQTYYLIALALFALCDICTALYFITALGFIGSIIWIFYAPSQILLGILMSHNAAIRLPPVHIPAFHLGGRRKRI